MQSRRNGEFKRSVLSALAAMVAAAVPSLVSSPAMADKPEASTADAKASTDPPAKQEPKQAAKKTQAPKGQKPQAKQDASAKKDASPKAQAAPAKKDTKAAHAAAPKGKKTKKTASRAASSRRKAAKKADKEAPRPCVGTSITIDRGGLEGQTLPMLDCHARPIEASREALSVLARPWGAGKPVFAADKAGSTAGPRDAKGRKTVAPPPHVAGLLDKGLLARVDAIAHRFPGRPISLVSGYRPQSRGSLHQSARALDLRVAGVTNEELVAFCRTLPDTGCGYYPNSSFVHVDVRNPGTGGVTWIDASGPGETPRYVKQWPEPSDAAGLAALPPDSDGEPHDGTGDPWARDPTDEHAAAGAPDAPAKDPFDEL
jgi:Peptidase M15